MQTITDGRLVRRFLFIHFFLGVLQCQTVRSVDMLRYLLLERSVELRESKLDKRGCDLLEMLEAIDGTGKYETIRRDISKNITARDAELKVLAFLKEQMEIISSVRDVLKPYPGAKFKQPGLVGTPKALRTKIDPNGMILAEIAVKVETYIREHAPTDSLTLRLLKIFQKEITLRILSRFETNVSWKEWNEFVEAQLVETQDED